MTPTERAKRSDALYYETVSVTRRVLCDMIANREADLEDAKAESEHMRLKALAVAGELQEESERLKADNAKLRELCAGLLTGYECGYGELCKGCTWDGLGDSKTFSCLPRVKARELGVEVSE